MINFVWAISASFILSLISLIGIFSILLQDKFLERILILLIGFSAGGLIGGASFIVSINFGVITTLVLVFHEILQEIGDFGVLIYGGFSRAKVLFYNFISALTCVLGTALGYYLTCASGNFSAFPLPLTAGGFIYIAACDLIPELHRQAELKRTAFSMLAFLTGITFILLTRLLHLH